MIADKRIALDIDGVLAGFQQALIDLAHSEGRSHWPLTWRDIRGWNDFGDFPKEEVHELCKKIKDDEAWWAAISPLEDAKYLNFSPIAYITARPIGSKVTTIWLRKHGFPVAPVYTVDDHYSKIDILKHVHATHMVEDRADTAIAICQAGITCYLINKPWNRNVEVPGYVPRIDSLREI